MVPCGTTTVLQGHSGTQVRQNKMAKFCLLFIGFLFEFIFFLYIIILQECGKHFNQTRMKCSLIQIFHIQISSEKQSCEREEDVACSIQAKGAPGDWNSYPFEIFVVFFVFPFICCCWCRVIQYLYVNGVTGELSCLPTPSHSSPFYTFLFFLLFTDVPCSPYYDIEIS